MRQYSAYVNILFAILGQTNKVSFTLLILCHCAIFATVLIVAVKYERLSRVNNDYILRPT